MFSTLLPFLTVDQQTVAVIERLGKFKKLSKPGFDFKLPIFDQVVGRLSMRLKQLNVDVETKTKDNVFVRIVVSVQYQVNIDKIYEAFYKLTTPDSQINSFIFDVVRAEVPKLTLDEAFVNKDNIAIAIRDELSQIMSEFGYDIVKALVTDVDPDEKVKAAMNEINQQERLKVAAEQKGEAEKILRVKQAEAEAESMRLQGEGFAAQRKAILEGLKASLQDFQADIEGASIQEILNLVLSIQYYDTLKEVGARSNSNTIMIPHSNDVVSSFREAIASGNLLSKSK